MPVGGEPCRNLPTSGEMALAVKTLQRRMVEKGICSPDGFRRKLQQLDLEDGRADGRAPVG